MKRNVNLERYNHIAEEQQLFSKLTLDRFLIHALTLITPPAKFRKALNAAEKELKRPVTIGILGAIKIPPSKAKPYAVPEAANGD